MQFGKLSRFVDFQQLVQICENRARFFRFPHSRNLSPPTVLGRSQPWASAIRKCGNIGKPDPNNQNIPTLAGDTFRTCTHDTELCRRRRTSRETIFLKKCQNIRIGSRHACMKYGGLLSVLALKSNPIEEKRSNIFVGVASSSWS